MRYGIGNIIRSLVSSWRTSPFTRVDDTQRRRSRPHPRSRDRVRLSPERSKFFPCVTLNFECRSQSRTEPSLAHVYPNTCDSAVSCGIRRPPRADDDHDLALVVELLGLARPHDRLAVGGQRRCACA